MKLKQAKKKNLAESDCKKSRNFPKSPPHVLWSGQKNPQQQVV